MTEVIDDPSLTFRVHQKQQEIAATSVNDLTIADRITRRALNQRITIDLGDPGDPILVDIRVPVSVELDVLKQSRRRLEQAETPEEVERITKELIEVVSDICLDDSLNEEFWTNGLFPVESLLQISKAANDVAAERIEEARNFRNAGSRAGVSPTMRKTRKVSA